jgi:hypothetical protein
MDRRLDRGLAGASEVAGEARALGYRPFEAAALISLSTIRQNAGDWQGALDAARDGMRAADAGHDGAQAAEAQSYSAFLLGTRLGRPAEAEAAARDTEARLEGLAELDPRRRSSILKFCAAGFVSAGKPTDARARYLTALALLDQRRSSARPRTASGEASSGGAKAPGGGSDDDEAIPPSSSVRSAPPSRPGSSTIPERRVAAPDHALDAPSPGSGQARGFATRSARYAMPSSPWSRPSRGHGRAERASRAGRSASSRHAGCPVIRCASRKMWW